MSFNTYQNTGVFLVSTNNKNVTYLGGMFFCKGK